MTRLTLAEVKQALADPAFRKKLPSNLKEDIQKYEQNPGCACNVPIYRNVIRYGAKQLREYFPERDIPNPDTEMAKLESQPAWVTFSCHIDELESKLKKLPNGQKQLAVARWQDQITVIVNELYILSENNWLVVSCHIEELESKMKTLPPGRKQIALARWEDQITVVVNELNY